MIRILYTESHASGSNVDKIQLLYIFK